MYETLTQKITATLEAVPNVKDVFTVPKTKLDKFPCVFFKPSSFENNFETNVENSATYRFLMIVMVGVSGTTVESAFGTILPRTVDAVIEKFNEDWDGGTIDGHRVRIKIDSADAWEVSEEQDGIVCYAPMSVEIRLLTSN